MERIKVGVFGAGHLGKRHIESIRSLPEYDFLGYYDPAVSLEGVHRFSTEEELIMAAEAVVIAAVTTSHYRLGAAAMRSGRHVFMEKPLAGTLEEAKALVKLSHEARVIGQVGHVERFNPAYLSVADESLQPLFIEVHRLAQWNPRGADVSVVLDLMIHDIDLVLSLVKSPVRSIRASGVAVISDTPDIANARIEFMDNCVANLTASRFSMKNMRRMRIFQPNAYLTLDFLERKSEIYRISAEPVENAMPFVFGDKTRYLSVKHPDTPKVNAIEEEHKLFVRSVRSGVQPVVNFASAYESLVVAHQVLEHIPQAEPVLA
jgi:predicted dehydrogenase